jgi:hypothetical protein
MAYSIAENALLGQAFADTSVKKVYEVGTIMRGKDPSLGGGEFVYLIGVANTLVGSAVIYDVASHQTTLAPIGANKPSPVAFAMSANPAGQFGWYQVSGMATAAKASATVLSAGVAVGIAAPGLVAASAAGQEIAGALTAAACANGELVVLLHISHPTMQGRIT